MDSKDLTGNLSETIAYGLITVVVFAVLVVAALTLLPFGLIWALNTLLPIEIAYTLWTWLAALLVIVIFNGPQTKRSK